MASTAPPCEHRYTDLKKTVDGRLYVVCEDCGYELGEYPLAPEED